MTKKHEVLKTFRDKETGQLILAGSFFVTDDKKRLDDLFKRELLKSEPKAKVKNETIEQAVKQDVVEKAVRKTTTRKKSGE